MASLSKTKSVSKPSASQAAKVNDIKLDYDSWDDSWGDSEDDWSLDSWDDDDEKDEEDDFVVAKGLRKKRTKPRRTILQVVKSNNVDELHKLLAELGPDDVIDSINEHDGKGYSPLHHAAHHDNPEMVKLLIEQGADVDDEGAASRRPLHFAAGAKGDKSSAKASAAAEESVIKLLLSKNATVNVRDNRGRTPLHISTLQGNVEAAKELLSCLEIDINAEDQRDMSALTLACLYGKTDIAVMLIDKKADLTVWDENLDTPLHTAFREGHKKIARKIIEAGKQTGQLEELLKEINTNNVAPIHEAVKGGHKDLIQLCLDCVSKPDRKDGDGDDDDDDDDLLNYAGENEDTPLHIACATGHLDIVKMLVDRGAKQDCENWNGQTPLHQACVGNHQNVAEYLAEKGADLTSKDEDGFSPMQVAANNRNFDTLLVLLDSIRNLDTSSHGESDGAAELLRWAAAENKAETVKLLLHHGSKLHGVSDDDVADFVLDAASKGHTETILALIRWKREVVIGRTDENGNTPLHLAAKAGHDVTVHELIKAKADVNATNYEEEDESTPLHYAAANGWIRTVKLLLKAKADIDERDQHKMTPLHYACKNGHIGMVKLLLYLYDQKADILLRDDNGLNCLDHAIDNGHEDITNLILSHNKWREVMSVSSLDDDTWERTTPFRKLIRHMPDVAERVMDKCVTMSDSAGTKDSDFWIEFYYEFLEDSFSRWDKPKEDDDGDENKGFESDDDVEDNEVTIPASEKKSDSPYNAKGHLKFGAKPYTSSSKEITTNHPLTIMVSSQRVRLLGHPLVSSVLNHKWRIGRFFFWASFFFYLLFVAMLTGYVIVLPPSYYIRHANQTAGVTWFVDGQERWIEGYHELTLFFFGRIGDWIILGLSVINLVREIFQLIVQRWSYFNAGNLLEWALYVLAILLVLPLSGVRYVERVSTRLDWQWQCGAVAVFLAWINLILFIRRFSVLGIYVIMFIDILRTFLKFVVILMLFIVAFALAFYTLLMNQQPFHRVEYAFAKTFVMMIGEIDYGDIFHARNYLRTENELADGEEDFFLNTVFYEGITYAIFSIFIVIMSILIMNLLVGLAVDDIHGIQEKAKLHRLAMQVELVMEVQQAVPVFIWRSAVIRSKKVYPNRSCCKNLRKWYRTLTGDQNLLRQAMNVCNKRASEGDFLREHDTTEQLFTNIKYRLKVIDNNVESITNRVNEDGTKRDGEMEQIQSKQKHLKDRLDRMESKIDALLKHSKVKWEDASAKSESK